MSEEHRSLTQVDNFLLTVAENSVQYSSSISSDIQVSRKRALEDQFSFFSSDSVFQSKDESKIAKLGKEKIERSIETFSQVSYNELMTRDQAESTIIDSDNSEKCNFVAIKRVKKVDNSLVHRIPSFNSDQLVEIRDMYQDNDDVVIIYEQMNVFLRHIIGLLQGSLKVFQIAAICKKIRVSFDRFTSNLLTVEEKMLNDLSYLHKKLSHYHDALSCDTILLNLEERVKIDKFVETDSIVANILQSTSTSLLSMTEDSLRKANAMTSVASSSSWWS